MRAAPHTPGSCTLAELRKLLEGSAVERKLHEEARASMSAVIVDLQEKLQAAEAKIVATSAELEVQDSHFAAIAMAQSADAASRGDRRAEVEAASASDRAEMTSRIASLEQGRAELTKKLCAARATRTMVAPELIC